MDAIPYVRFVFALFLGGLLLYIGIPIVDIMESIFPASGTYYNLMHGIWSAFPVIILFREFIVLLRAVASERGV
jgi:hypothetical protein